ncbi:hypothetical protein H5P28_07570 [Ruficoccus amylovorans]|uniref:Uncharacterized protein n=1 Tax=Ruficoccus amylovorans TaxID=1804625 RepID=A0A842HD04_9BACT|nr:hypothetical protein [Ruficoccus amylovorans]MBC2594120.1 hypothetical protein [Ruficoccus amylovorans]
MLEVNIRYLEEDMRTPRKGDQPFARRVDADDLLDLLEDLRESSIGLGTHTAPELFFRDSEGLLLVRAEEGHLAWSRPEMEGTGSVPTTAEEFTGFLFPDFEEKDEEPEENTRVYAQD